MIRLFANMIAGHMVIMSFLGLVIIFGWVAFPAIFLAIFIYCLEVFIALLQAYIFILLSAVFIGQMYHPDH
jgi:F-type H+-transporting ATPase subunit a